VCSPILDSHAVDVNETSEKSNAHSATPLRGRAPGLGGDIWSLGVTIFVALMCEFPLTDFTDFRTRA
jgi:hypothetical protein